MKDALKKKVIKALEAYIMDLETMRLSSDSAAVMDSCRQNQRDIRGLLKDLHSEPASEPNGPAAEWFKGIPPA